MKKTLQVCYAKVAEMLARVCILIIVTAFLAGCGSKMSGKYIADNSGSLYKQLNFTSGTKVEITAVVGVVEGTYVVEGDKVKITVGMATHIFTKDSNGCLDGGGGMGKFCKE